MGTAFRITVVVPGGYAWVADGGKKLITVVSSGWGVLRCSGDPDQRLTGRGRRDDVPRYGDGPCYGGRGRAAWVLVGVPFLVRPQNERSQDAQ